MSDDAQRAKRVARQQLATSRLLGVDFVPAPAPGSAATATVAAPPPRRSSKAKRKTRIDALEQLKTDHDAACPHCTTAEGHTQTVFGEGDPDAKIMFVGEAPGAEEDRTGRPFVGRAGKKLEEMIGAMGMQREDVYIANILKARPPDNRTPLIHEVEACAPYLAEQIRIIRPKVIVALGNPSTKFLLNTQIGITKMRGHWASYDDGDLHIDIMPTFHPSYLLRNYTRESRQQVWSDLQAVLKRLGRPI